MNRKYIEKVILPSEKKYKLLSISGEDNKLAREIFKDFFGKKRFTLETHKGVFKDAYFNEKSLTTTLRLMCPKFFKKIKVDDVIYIQVKDENTVLITNKEPVANISETKPVEEQQITDIDSPIDFIRKDIDANYILNFGQIVFSQNDTKIAKKIFKNFLGGKKFKLETHKGIFEDVHFNDDQENQLILSCSNFFGTLQRGNVIYLQVKDENTILITDTEPVANISETKPVEEQQITNVDSPIDFIGKEIDTYYILNFGQIAFSQNDTKIAKKIFKNFLGGKKFKLETHKGIFQDVHFNDHQENQLKLSCSNFFKTLQIGDVIYLQVKDENTVLITDKEPAANISETKPVEKQQITNVNSPIDFIRKDIDADYILNFGQIAFSQNDTKIAKKIFKNFLGGKKFKLETHKGIFQDVHFNDHQENQLKLSCSNFFKTLQIGNVIYLQVKDENTILITDTEPVRTETLASQTEPLEEQWITDLENNIKKISNDVPSNKKKVDDPRNYPEQATRFYFINKLINALGYNVNERNIVRQEYRKFVGTNNKIDYAIFKDGIHPVMIIECKHCNIDLNEDHWEQLAYYFKNVKPKFNFAVLTNGIKYNFYTNAEDEMDMDNEPFWKIDLLNLKEGDIELLSKFHNEKFDIIAWEYELEKIREAIKRLKRINKKTDLIKFFANKVDHINKQIQKL